MDDRIIGLVKVTPLNRCRCCSNSGNHYDRKKNDANNVPGKKHPTIVTLTINEDGENDGRNPHDDVKIVTFKCHALRNLFEGKQHPKRDFDRYANQMNGCEMKQSDAVPNFSGVRHHHG